MGRHSKATGDPFETEEQFRRDVAEVERIIASAEEPGAVTRNHPDDVAHWIVGYVQNAHPEIYREALRARGEETARKGSTLTAAYAEALREGTIRKGTVVFYGTLHEELWRVESKYYDGTRMKADVVSPDGTGDTFWLEDLTESPDQSWPPRD